ncbi:MAG: MaoC/PaaZ C-terminal domain-containing protein [Actinomycetota bacterium]|nr:MaoC/PaaZ C-terminal domain-containing protein [Actinomycetota bacterium]
MTVESGLRASEVSVGHRFEVVVIENLTRTRIVQYAGVSGDYNPIHTDERFATEAAGYPSVFAHGMLTMGLTGTALTSLVGIGRLTDFGARFAAQVWPGDTLTGAFEVTGIRSDAESALVDLSMTVTNQDGRNVLTGSATARVES